MNIVGCLFAGFLFYLFQERFVVNEDVRLALMIGFLGGFTTFSSFGLQTFALKRDGQFILAAGNVLISNVACLLMVWVGYSLARFV